MAIDAARPEDATAVREVARAAWRVDYPVTRETAEETVDEWYDPTTVRAAIDADDAVVLVARSDDTATEVEGFTHAVLGPDDDEAAILRVYVHPESRRRAVGTALVRATLRRLRSAGAERIEAMVLADNDAGVEFYRSLGFELARTEETVIGDETHEERVYVPRE